MTSSLINHVYLSVFRVLQAHAKYVPHLPGKRWLPESIPNEFTHHKFKFTKVCPLSNHSADTIVPSGNILQVYYHRIKTGQSTNQILYVCQDAGYSHYITFSLVLVHSLVG